MSNNFPGQSVVNAYLRIEGMLSDVLRIVPYCTTHETVWSDALVPVLLESCSLLDSLWKYEAGQSSCVTKTRFTMVDYFTYFGQYMQPQWLVFWAEKPEVLEPFLGWSKSGNYQPDDYSELAWWKVYNDVKHDRLLNRTSATLAASVRALAGLFLAVLRCEFCRDAIGQTDWLSSLHANPVAFLGEDSGLANDDWVVAESKLFSCAVGWTRKPVPHNWTWQGPASHRFCEWFTSYSRL